MKDQIFLALILIGTGFGLYTSLKKKNEKLLYATLFCASIYSTKYPIYVPFEFALSFNGFFGGTIILYKIFREKQDRSLLVLSPLLFSLGLFSFLNHFLAEKHMKIWAQLEIVTGVCSLLGFGFLLYRILRRKLDKSFIVFDMILLFFGITFMAQGLFLH